MAGIGMHLHALLSCQPTSVFRCVAHMAVIDMQFKPASQRPWVDQMAELDMRFKRKDWNGDAQFRRDGRRRDAVLTR